MDLKAYLTLNTAGFIGPMGSARTALSGLTGALSSALGPLAAITAGIAGVATVGAGLKKALSNAGDLEDFITSFRVLLGSTSGAKQLAADLQRLSAASHLSMDSLANGAQTLLSFGVAGDQITKTLRQIADVSGGNVDRFHSLALVFGQSASAGKLMGQDLLQYINAGFNPLQEIAAKTGQSMATLRKEVEAGNISFAQVADAFRTATSEGGRFFGFTEAKAQTFKGLFATLENRVSAVFTAFGKPIDDALKPILTQAIGLVSGLQNSAAAFGKTVVEAFGTMRNVFAHGDLGPLLAVSLKLGLAEAVNYGAAGFNALAETFGILLGSDLKAGFSLLEALGTADFWKGMGNELKAAAIGFMSVIRIALAGMLETLSDLKGLGFLKNTAGRVRSEAKGEQAQAGALMRKGGSQLDPLFEALKGNLKQAGAETMEAFKTSFNNIPDLFRTGEMKEELHGLLTKNLPAAVIKKPDPPDPAKRAAAGAEDAVSAVKKGARLEDGDRLSKIGLMIGGGAALDYARRTAASSELLLRAFNRYVGSTRLVGAKEEAF